MAWLRRRPKTFPLADSQPYNFLNLDLYAQDTWKVTRNTHLDLRSARTHNSNPLNPHDAVARLAGSFDSISHDVNQPLDAGDPDRARKYLRNPRRWRFCSPEPRSPGRSRRKPCCAADSACSAISAGQRGRSGGRNPPYSKTFQGRAARHGRRNGDRAGSARQRVDATVAANQRFNSGFAQGQLSCASPLAESATCLQPVAITAVPDGKIHAPYFMQWSFALEHQIGTTVNLRAQYVGTRAVNQPYKRR
jgi:hypothetical protein